MFTADRRKMGELVAPRWVTALAALTAVIVIALNVKLIVDQIAPIRGGLNASRCYSAASTNCRLRQHRGLEKSRERARLVRREPRIGRIGLAGREADQLHGGFHRRCEAAVHPLAPETARTAVAVAPARS